MKAIKVRPAEVGAFNRGRRTEDTYHLPYYNRKIGGVRINLPVNKRTLLRIWDDFHTYTSHSTAANALKYRAAAQRFERQHMPYQHNRSSLRFINKYTAHAWM